MERLTQTAAFAKLFSDVKVAGGGQVTIPPGTYALAGNEPIKLVSNSHITANGAVFLLPEKLGDQARVVLFAGEDVCDFSWCGGEFRGRCFDPNAESNTWEPNANTRAILLTTSAKGKSKGLLFRDIKSDGVAGAVVTVLGVSEPGSESEVANYATDVTLENCTLLNSGKFMWDYGYLWQIAVWPEEYTDSERALASKYFPQTLIRSGLQGDDRDDRVRFDNGTHRLPVAKTSGPNDALVFFGGTLPENIVRGKQYFIIESEKQYIKVAESPGGKPIVFNGSFGSKAKLIHDHFRAFLALYEPQGSGPGKGAFDLVAGKDVRVSGCKLERSRGHDAHPEVPEHRVHRQPHSRLPDGGLFLGRVLQERDSYRQYGRWHQRFAGDERREVLCRRYHHREHFPEWRSGQLDQSADQLCTVGQRVPEQHHKVRTRPEAGAQDVRHRRLRVLPRVVFHPAPAGREVWVRGGRWEHLRHRPGVRSGHYLRPQWERHRRAGQRNYWRRAKDRR